MESWLVTGGLGFIGSNFIQMILTKFPDITVYNLDLITYAGNPMNMKDYEQNSRYNFIQGNISNSELVNLILKKYGISKIVNFAAESHVDRSILNPDIFIDSNVKGTLNLLNIARANRIKRYLQISTDEVYGSLGFQDAPFTEKSPIDPRSPYSASKASADMLVQAYFHTFHLPVVITRCSNNYGPYQFPEKLIPLMIRNILLNKKLPVYGDGKNIRDWIYVEDHCMGIYAAMMNGKDGEIYNFGGNSEISNLNLVKILLKKLQKSDDLIEFVKDRPGHDLRYAMNYSKAQKELKWEPKYKFEDGIEKTVQWYLNHQDWIQSITSGAYLDYIKKQYGSP